MTLEQLIRPVSVKGVNRYIYF